MRLLFDRIEQGQRNKGPKRVSPSSLCAIFIPSALAILAVPCVSAQEACVLHLPELIRAGSYGTILFSESVVKLPWDGPCENGAAEEYGEATGSGWHFRGTARQGRPTRGWLDFAEGGFYVGPFSSDGLPEGDGISVYINGSIRKEVVATWHNGRADGEGSFEVTFDGSLSEAFVGSFERGKPAQGHYYVKLPYEQLRIGSFSEHMHLEGPGRTVYGDTAILEASFRDGQAIGKGVYQNPQGVVFDIYATPGEDWDFSRRSSGVSPEFKRLAGALAAGAVLSQLLEAPPNQDRRVPSSASQSPHRRLAACAAAAFLGDTAGQADVSALISSVVEAIGKERDLSAAGVAKSVLVERVLERIKERDPEPAALVSSGLFVECLLD